jgi:hypothetical protein
MRINLKAIMVLAFVASVGACTSAPQGDWIEVPLSTATYWEQSGGYRSGEYEIPVPAGTDLEYKISMAQGAMVVYEWTVVMPDPAQLKVEFHGHTEREPGQPGTLMYYKVHNAGRESGTLRAPFTGIHGWYLNNTSDMDVVVKLKVAGVYDEV